MNIRNPVPMDAIETAVRLDRTIFNEPEYWHITTAIDDIILDFGIDQSLNNCDSMTYRVNLNT